MTHIARSLLALALLLACAPAWGQKFGYIDTEFIMGKMPEYAQAQTELAKLTETWQKEIEVQKKDLDKLYRTYQAEEVVLTEAMKKKRQDEILKKEQDIKAYESKQFGYEGQLFKKRVELNKPAQDKIFDAVEKVVKARKLDFMFDRNGDLTMLYANPTHDYTEFVLEELGLGSPTRNQPGPKGPVKTVKPPKTPTASADPAFESDSGTPDPASTTEAAGATKARPTKGAKATKAVAGEKP
ncbi:OmpH family outer membrane protein [Hymenobacter sp. H14-R3]|uniref:OmpH family outer membrane protein n=1 Tax=Hymenobacter sp. H14-R3 TaxID=3046308 RepID=UPI0024BAC521|nr:OmpH family outer membrane protein [Hymenobacter sp. H14-R3]MDJ0363870.1 OmpH family outer membrane protein [Hymenobacter sp. H14-R3]